MILYEFHQVADCLHALAIVLLIFFIHKRQSCYSVSGLTMILYTIIFTHRYLSLYSSDQDYYNSWCKPAFDCREICIAVGRMYHLLPSFVILFFIYGLFRSTRDKLNDTHPPFGYLIGVYLIILIICFWTNSEVIDQEFFWQSSIYLEIFAIIPQLRLVYKQGTINKEMKFYLIMLALYRIFYIPYWIYRTDAEDLWESSSLLCGCIQTLVYVMFFVRIYPALNNGNKCQSVEVTKDFIKIVDTEETTHNQPLVAHV